MSLVCVSGDCEVIYTQVNCIEKYQEIVFTQFCCDKGKYILVCIEGIPINTLKKSV